MRWFSHRARTWKDTVLKIKIKKKAKGFTLVATALAVLCWIFIAQAFFMMSSGTLSTVKAERVANQAEQNAALDVSRLKALDYDDLDSKGAHARKVIDGVGDGNWESEVTIDPEQPLNGGDDDAKLRIAHVKVYRTGDTTSRYSLDVPLTSQSSVGKDNSSNNRKVIDADSIDADLKCTITNQGYRSDFVECGATWYGYVTSVKPAQKAATYKGQLVKEDTPAYQSKERIILATEYYGVGTYPGIGDPYYKIIIDEKKQQWATDERTKYNTYTWMQDWDGKYNVSITGTNFLSKDYGRY